MTRRTSLPGAAELFRQTGRAPSDNGNGNGDGDGWFDAGQPASTHRARPASPRRGSPRQKHPSKITVYVSDEELLALEHSRLALRATHGLAVDRGRIVREAVAIMLADLEEHGDNSMLVRRLRGDASQ
ncbi:MAG TPA: cobyrinic acid a,c-diamide synthase [Actinophytocola sp.]|uniref:cobyrinic acid a,c-diamide synthase n=1 Tax=Actinophytocola sp. TaxID=1872138 RepID=UPI002DDD80FB|nr:cobyrinic acid a,c-diamide synthase [Actinophytocola sp.]HEV2780026.1 cobyrinic acid a,c-diamide synthase [Actinophytocola sp.]